MNERQPSSRYPPLILASASPRRQFLLSLLGVPFVVRPSHADESFSPEMPLANVSAYLAIKKAASLRPTLSREILITADTVVIIDNQILNKPADEAEARQMLGQLSGRQHTVVTAVCLTTADKQTVFSESSQVHFNLLAFADIENYVRICRPFDKAGAYGAQECLPAFINPYNAEEIDFLQNVGQYEAMKKISISDKPLILQAIRHIEGSFFNVMGLPIHRMSQALDEFLS